MESQRECLFNQFLPRAERTADRFLDGVTGPRREDIKQAARITLLLTIDAYIGAPGWSLARLVFMNVKEIVLRMKRSGRKYESHFVELLGDGNGDESHMLYDDGPDLPGIIRAESLKPSADLSGSQFTAEDLREVQAMAFAQSYVDSPRHSYAAENRRRARIIAKEVAKRIAYANWASQLRHRKSYHKNKFLNVPDKRASETPLLRREGKSSE